MALETNIPIGGAQQRIEKLPAAPLQLPKEGGPFILDQGVIDAFPVPRTNLIQAVRYAHSIGSSMAKLEAQVSDNTTAYYFLKIVTGPTAKSKCEGEYEALKVIYAVSQGFAPEPHAWGELKESEPETYFLLEDFVKLQNQIARGRVHARLADPNNMDLTGRTPVLHAVDSHDVNSLQVILEAGGDPNPTPLTAAGFAGMPTLLKLLLDFEANPNACNPEGLTALHSVARTHNTECAVLLLEYVADLNAMSSTGRTPLTAAIIHNNHPVLRLFVDRCYEFMITTDLMMPDTYNRSLGPEILPIIVEHADVETINILASAHPLKVSNDVSFNSIASNRRLLAKRRDYDEKLADAFEELITIASAEADETKSVDSILETGFFSARSAFHSLAGAISTMKSVDVTQTDSDNDENEEWKDSREHFQTPTSPTSRKHFQSPTSPTSRENFRSPTSPARENFHAFPPSSPLRRQVSR